MHWLDKCLLYIRSRYSFSRTWFMLSSGKKRQQYKHRLHRRHHKKPMRTTIVSALFRQFGSCFGLFFLALQDKYNTYNVICQKIYNSFVLSTKQNRKVCQRLTFIPVTKACTNKFYFFRQYTYIFYVQIIGFSNLC